MGPVLTLDPAHKDNDTMEHSQTLQPLLAVRKPVVVSGHQARSEHRIAIGKIDPVLRDIQCSLGFVPGQHTKVPFGHEAETRRNRSPPTACRSDSATHKVPAPSPASRRGAEPNTARSFRLVVRSLFRVIGIPEIEAAVEIVGVNIHNEAISERIVVFTVDFI